MTNTDIDNIQYARLTMNREPIKAIADILSTELEINSSRVFLMNSLRELPKDEGVFIVLQEATFPPFGLKKEYKMVSGVYTEVQSYMTKQRITISLLSKNTDARLQKFDINMALNSTYSQQVQEQYGFHISSVNPVSNRSFLEETSRLYRYDTEATVITAYSRQKAVDYYEVFDDTITIEA